MNKFSFYFISFVAPICSALLGYVYGDLLHRPGVEIAEGFSGASGAITIGTILLGATAAMIFHVVRENLRTNGMNASNRQLIIQLIGSLSLTPLFAVFSVLSERFALHQIHQW